jgi:hypothetical protein
MNAVISKQEFLQAYKFLRSMVPDLEDVLQIELREVMDDFVADLVKFNQKIGPEPSYVDYAEAIDAILGDEGYPPLFAEFC